MGNIKFGNQGNDIIEVTLRDYSGAKIDQWRCNAKDDGALNKIILMIKQKYGTDPFTKDWLGIEGDFFKF